MQSIPADLARPESFDAIVSTVLSRFGRIDVLVNNAGIGQASIRPDARRNPIRMWEITPEQWQRFLTVNATGPIMMARAVVPHMLAAGAGRVITVTTSLGTMVREGYLLYGASKAAAEAAMAVLAADLKGTGVTSNVLVPGGVTNTGIVGDEAGDRRRMLQPEIMVPPLLWLISDAAAAVTARRFVAMDWDASLPADAGGREGRGADRVAGDRADAGGTGVRSAGRVRCASRAGRAEVWFHPACGKSERGPAAAAIAIIAPFARQWVIEIAARQRLIRGQKVTTAIRRSSRLLPCRPTSPAGNNGTATRARDVTAGTIEQPHVPESRAAQTAAIAPVEISAARTAGRPRRAAPPARHRWCRTCARPDRPKAECGCRAPLPAPDRAATASPDTA